jgi:enterochelin esterase-like enzyme
MPMRQRSVRLLRMSVLVAVMSACGSSADSTAPDVPAVTPPIAAFSVEYASGGTRANVARNAAFTNSLVASTNATMPSYSVSGGALPPGISLSPAGVFSGSAAASGSYAFTVRASTGQTAATQAFTVIVNPSTLAGTVQTVTFTGALTRRPVTFTLYLPPGYASSSARFPVVYHLHGIGGAHNGNQISLVPLSLEAAVSAGLMDPAIVVFPDGYGDSFWSGEATSTKPAEVNVAQEIVPYVDSVYRTLARRERRVMQGFSMGGFGAAKFATKFPALFGVCVVYDGAMLDWSRLQMANAQQAASIFGGSSTRFDQYSPFFWLTQNAATLRSSTPFRDAVGALIADNDRWRASLVAAGITPEYTYTGLPHALGPLLDAQGANSWVFIKQQFTATP